MAFGLDESFPLFRGKLVQMTVNVLYIVIFADKFSGSDFSYTLYSRDIVG